MRGAIGDDWPSQTCLLSSAWPLHCKNMLPSEATGQHIDLMCSELGVFSAFHKTCPSLCCPLCPAGGGPLMLAAPSSSEPVQKKSFSEGSGTEAAGLQMLDSSKFAFLSQFGPREWAAAHSLERVGSARSVTFSVIGSSKGTSKFHMTAFAPAEDVTFLVTKEAILATCEKLELKPTELASVYKTVALFRIKLVADSLWMRCWTRSAVEGLAFWYRTGSTHHVTHVRAWTGRGRWIEEFWAARCKQQQPQSQGRQECRRRSTR